ncbi:MAG: hypothetical protein E5Y10_22900 [Mesorhizobium sp.]|uniref:hypothetical protein n=1 Tax=Mesorhizobium sp. TaxID=1871066 RepID=UPI00120E4598|nr:hypothetical protein [Mesorhizobium sp.]TIN41393.1 MAG: hypothetical protein E5Y13_05755 [Mesorhizobium sp.]TJU86171.1 MAG: hypothetical protein E5Y10_22900 [Mesorhizobium sp.]
MASRFWVGSTGTWDASDTTHWSAASGGAGGASVPGAADTVTFDANSGGGTVTVNTTVTVISIACGAFTGTLDFSVNNNNVTLSGGTNAFSGTGTGARTIKLGNGTWTFTTTATSGGIVWNMGTTTNLTFDAGSSVINFSGDAVPAGGNAVRVFSGGNLTYATIEVAAQSNGGKFNLSGANTIGTLTVSGTNDLIVAGNQTIGTLSLNGTSTELIVMESSTSGQSRTISVASNPPTLDWVAFRDITGAGGASFVADNSFDLGRTVGITINAPGAGGGGAAQLVDSGALVG